MEYERYNILLLQLALDFRDKLLEKKAKLSQSKSIYMSLGHVELICKQFILVSSNKRNNPPGRELGVRVLFCSQLFFIDKGFM